MKLSLVMLVLTVGFVVAGLTGCSSFSVPELTGGLALNEQDNALASTTDIVPNQQVAEQEVGVKSSAKAPKGALSDRDYSGAALDPDAALAAINSYRGEKGLPPLKLDARLTAAAKAHSRDLAKSDRISHYGSDGSSPWDRVARTGYAAALAAENIGTGQASMLEVIKGWKGSAAHNQNLLLPDAEDMGIALVQEPKSEFKTFWTLVVGTSQ